MITIQMYRDKDGEHYNLGVHTAGIASALQSLLRSELGYGGAIESTTKTAITVKTFILNCLDTTVFYGSEEEMEYLLHGISAYEALAKHNFNEDVDRLIERTRGVALLVGTFYGHERIQGRLKIVTGEIMKLLETTNALFMIVKETSTQKNTFLVDPIDH